MVRHNEVRVARHEQPRRVDPSLGQEIDLLEEHLGIYDHAGSDNRRAMRIQDSRRNQMHGVTLSVHDDGVTRVVAALITNDDLRVLGKEVGDLTFALVSPLDADESDSRHIYLSSARRGHYRSIRNWIL